MISCFFWIGNRWSSVGYPMISSAIAVGTPRPMPLPPPVITTQGSSPAMTASRCGSGTLFGYHQRCHHFWSPAMDGEDISGWFVHIGLFSLISHRQASFSVIKPSSRINYWHLYWSTVNYWATTVRYELPHILRVDIGGGRQLVIETAVWETSYWSN